MRSGGRVVEILRRGRAAPRGNRATCCCQTRRVGSETSDPRRPGIRTEGGGPRAHRHLRPRGHRPARFADRPVQSAVHVLHARRGPAVAGQARPAHATTRSSGSIGIAVTRLGIEEVRFTGGEPLLRPGLRRHRRAGRGPGPPPPDVPDHQRHRPRAHGRRPASDAGLDRVNVSLDTLRPDVFKTLTRRNRHQDVLRGPGSRPRRRPDPGQGQHRPDAGAQRRRGPRPARLGRGARLRAALHRADAARRPARLEARRHDHRRRHPRLPAHPLRRSPPRAQDERGSAPAERWLVDGGPHRVGVIASVTRPFCRGLRPHPAHRRRPGPHLPVRHARRRTCARALRSGAPDEEIARIWRLAMWGKKAGSGLDDPSFLQPDRPMSAIGG